jgi:hypothetical protein
VPNFKLSEPSDDLTAKSSSEGTQGLKALLDQTAVTTNPEASNRLLGKLLIIFTEMFGLSYVQAWRIVRPDSKANDASAQSIVSRWKAHHRKKYPLTISESLELTGITIEGVMKLVDEMMNKKKWAWDPEQNRHVETDEMDVSARNLGITQLRHFMALDRTVMEEAVLGKKEKPMQLDLPTVNAAIQEWEEWAQGEETGVLAERTQAAEEMKQIAEGRRIEREMGKEEADRMKQIAEGHRQQQRQGRRSRSSPSAAAPESTNPPGRP